MPLAGIPSMRLVRRTIRHSPVLYWAIALAVAALAAGTVSTSVERARAAEARLGGATEVPVAVRAIDAGARIRAGDVEVRRVPVAFVPDAPVAATYAGEVAAVSIAAGEVVLEAKLAGRTSAIAAALPHGTRGVAVATGVTGLPPLERGDVVDVLVTLDDGEPTFVVAPAALVIDVGDEAVTVAVSQEEAPAVAHAAALGVVTLALSGPSSPAG